MNRDFLGLGRVLAGVASALVLLGTARGGISTLREYEETLAQVRGIAIRVTETAAEQDRQFRQLTRSTQQLGATTRFSAREIGQAQLFLARTGFEVNDILGALPGTLSLAAATSIDLGQAADLASNALKQFQLEATEMNRVADVLANTTIRTNTDIIQLAEALKLVGPIANAVGVDIETTTALVGKLGDAGIQGSLAGTQLRGVIAAISAPTGNATRVIGELADRLGVSADQFNLATESADGFTHPLLRVLRLLNEAGTTPREFFEIFGRRQAAGAILLADQIDAVEALAAAQLEAEGTAKRLADIQENTLAGAFRRLNAATEALTLSIGERGLGSALRSTVEFTVAVIRELAGVEVAGEKASETVRRVAEAVRILSVVAGVFVAVGIVGAVVALGSALAALLGTIGTVGVALAAVVGTVFAFRNSLVEVGDEVVQVKDLVAASFEVIVERIAFALEAATRFGRIFYETWAEILGEVGDLLGRLFDRISPVVSRVLSVVGTMIRTWANNTIAIFRVLGRTIELALTEGVERGVQAVTRALGEVAGVAAKTADALNFFGQLDEQVAAARTIEAALKFAGARSGPSFLDGVRDIVNEEVGRDFIGEFAEFGIKSFESFRDSFKLGLKAVGFSDEEIAANFSNVFEDIASRAAERFNARFAERIAEFGARILPKVVAAATGAAIVAGTAGAAVPGLPQFDPDTLLKASEAETAFVGEEVLQDTIASLQQTLDLTRLVGVERQVEIDLLQAKEELLRRAKELTPDQEKEQLAALEAGRASIRQLEEQIELTERLSQLGVAVGRNIGTALERIVIDGGKARDVAAALAQELARAAFQAFITSQLTGFFSSVFAGSTAESFAGSNPIAAPGTVPGAKGLIFSGPGSHRRVIPMRTGNALRAAAGAESISRLGRGRSASIASGIIDSPTLLPQALLGEGARPEGVFPLDRSTSGALGIMAAVGGRNTVLPIGRLGDGNLGVVLRGSGNSGNVRAFATGGLLNGEGPVGSMPMGGGGSGSPLGPVGSGPMGGGSTTINRTTTFNLPNVTDVDQFKRSTRQLARNVQRRFPNR